MLIPVLSTGTSCGTHREAAWQVLDAKLPREQGLCGVADHNLGKPRGWLSPLEHPVGSDTATRHPDSRPSRLKTVHFGSVAMEAACPKVWRVIAPQKGRVQGSSGAQACVAANTRPANSANSFLAVVSGRYVTKPFG